MKTVLGTMLRGEKACLGLVMASNDDGDCGMLPVDFCVQQEQLPVVSNKPKQSGSSILAKLR